MDKLMLIDGNSILNRAFYALPLLKTKEGLHTNAVHGFLTMLINVVEEQKPAYLVVTFDTKGGNFRHKLYEQYKGTRKGMPDELAEQLPLLKSLLDDLGVYRLELSGFEADDLMGTLAHIGEQEGLQTIIISGDKDTLQLVSETTIVGITKKGTKDVQYFDPQMVKQDMGITPDQVIDYKGLRGDASDNIPGVSGIGEVGAIKLLNGYPHLEDVYDHLEEISGKLKERLEQQKEMAFLSRTLATIDRHVPLDRNPVAFHFSGFKGEQALPALQRYGLKNVISLLKIQFPATEEQPLKNPDIPQQDHVSVFIDQNLGQYTFYVKAHNLTVMDETSFRAFLDHKPKLVGFQLQKWCRIFAECGFVWPEEIFDVSLEHYLLYPDRNSESLQEVLGMAQIRLDVPGLEQYLERLENTHNRLYLELEAKQLLALYHQIELPLVPILAQMTEHGFRVDRRILAQMDGDVTAAMAGREKQIYEMAGTTFNINSPKQLGEILFESLKLPHGKKTKTGYSTNRDVLHKLRDRHPVIEEILEYRMLAKLKGTYIDGLDKVIGADSKIHTSFNQTIAVTGRLSSKDPNLQNIPIRLEEGRRIRKMFVPSDDQHVLLAADYNQIELRVLAHISQDEHLIDAYTNDQDIHQMTASKVFDIPFDQVTREQRREAKAVNFGIVYGISDFGLSENIDIPIAAAKDYIQKYFEEYPKIKSYMDGIIKFCEEHGYVKTLLGRIREIPEIHSKNFNLRNFAKRTAMNTPIQGSAADIIKLSMIKVDQELKKHGLHSKMILQVHDELIFDAVRSELEILKAIVKKAMEEAYPLAVPLKVSMDTGENWYETK